MSLYPWLVNVFIQNELQYDVNNWGLSVLLKGPTAENCLCLDLNVLVTSLNSSY